MYSITHFFSEFGAACLGIVWLPIALWTAVTFLLIVLIKIFEDKVAAVYHYHTRVALLWGLAAGVFGSIFFHYFPISPASSNELSTRFIVIQNPMTVVSATSSTSIDWTSLSLWLGSVSLLITGITVIAIIKLLIDFRSLNALSKNLRMNAAEMSRITKTNQRLIARYNNISIVFSDDVDIPCTFGWLRKQIVLPVTLTNHPEKLNMALRHELTHIENNDFLLNTSTRIIKAFFYFHPLVHRLSGQIDEYREIYCDQHVLQDKAISQKNYALLLFELSPKSVFKTRAAVNMAVHHSTLEKRIRIIQTSTRHLPSFRRSVFFMLAATLMITGLMACSDMEESGITQAGVQRTQANIEKAPENRSPLFVLDGEKMTSSKEKNIMARLKPKYIKSVDVLKDTAATSIYGEEAKNGVVYITLSVDKDIVLNDLADHPLKELELQQNPKEKTYVAAEKTPKIIGGQQALYEKLQYPQSCYDANIEGRVILQFVVTKEGNVEDVQAIKGIGGGCDQAAINAIKQMHFKPAMQNGEAVNMQYSWPVLFQLNRKDDEKSSKKTADDQKEISGLKMQDGVITRYK